jgi:hypothetical protein
VDSISYLNGKQIDTALYDNEYLENWISEIRSSNDPFKSHNKNYNELKDKLKIEEINHVEYRKAKSILVNEFQEKIEKCLNNNINSTMADVQENKTQNQSGNSKQAGQNQKNSGNPKGPKGPKGPMFIALNVDDVEHDRLVTFVKSHTNLENLENLKKYLHHLTLMHVKDMKKDKDHWNKLIELKDQEVTVHVNKLYIGVGVVLGANVLMDDENKNDLVKSGVPHITGYLPESMKPFESIRIIQEKEYEKDLNVDYKFTAKVSFN